MWNGKAPLSILMDSHAVKNSSELEAYDSDDKVLALNKEQFIAKRWPTVLDKMIEDMTKKDLDKRDIKYIIESFKKWIIDNHARRSPHEISPDMNQQTLIADNIFKGKNQA